MAAVQDPGIRYARNGDVSIAYRVIGDGPVDLIFVTGFVGHLEIALELPAARRFFDRLGSFCRVLLFDKRGFGLSDRGAGYYTIEAVAEDMAAVLDAVGIERAAVFGVSEGGPAAALFAGTHAERATALVQYGTYGRTSRAPDYPAGLPVERIREFCERMVETWGSADSLPLFAPEESRDPAWREWWGRLLRAGTSPAGVRGLFEMYEKLDVRPVLPSITVPSLVLWRRGDRLILPPLSRAMAEAVPGAKGVELDGDAHLFIAGDQESLIGEVEEFLTGQRAAQPAERTLATVLFTDIVGSTERAAAEGDRRWRLLLEEHDRLARAVVERQRGRLVKSTGDGLLASFEGPARAIQAAVELRARLRPLDLGVRAGVHTGECERIGDDLGGIAVHIGARVSAQAGPGEVLVSQTVRDLVVGSGIEFEDRGAATLKGVPGEWRLFAVEGGG
ncbi:MAG TPA: adenylate/guanylate cyclase domain-containing protein [Solirubrobacterales bacterium]|nr:adenylate/guanylate cyclase domain-containing protein [Solirubrobacterales bacterium]